MEIDSSSPQQPAPRQPQPGTPPRPIQPISRRPVVDGFVPRRPAPPAHTAPTRPAMGQHQPPRPMGGDIQATPRPTATPQQTAVPATAALPHSQRPQPFTTRPMNIATRMAHTEAAGTREANVTNNAQPESTAHAPRERSDTGHAGLVGLVTFIVLGILFALPLIPGKIMQNFPLTSSTLSTGNQSLDCIGTQGQTYNSTVYNSKAGAPLTYTYSTSTTQSATCNGQSQSAVVERTSQFNPLALVLDMLLAVILAAVTARVWRIVYAHKHRSPRTKTHHTSH